MPQNAIYYALLCDMQHLLTYPQHSNFIGKNTLELNNKKKIKQNQM